MKTATIALSATLFILLVAGGYGILTLRGERAALQARVAELEQECEDLQFRLKSAQDEIAKSEYAGLIAAIKVGREIMEAANEVEKSTTSLLKDKQREAFSAKVETLKGRRIAIAGTVKDVGKRLISLSQLYLTLETDTGLTVKLIFGKEAEAELLGYKVGERLVFEGYVVSTGDLMHDLTIGGATRVDASEYRRASQLVE